MIYEGMIIVESLSFLCSSLLSYKEGPGDKQSLAKGGVGAISIIIWQMDQEQYVYRLHIAGGGHV